MASSSSSERNGSRPASATIKYIYAFAHNIAGVALVALLGVILATVSLSCGPLPACGGWPSAIGASILIFLASAVSASVLGLIFGIPRAVAIAKEVEVKGGSEASGKTAIGQRYEANTNLEQVSDWLTKALVGIGLVEMHTIAQKSIQLANWLSPMVAGSDQRRGAAVVLVLLVLGAGLGFLFGYVLTRTFLPLMLTQADKDNEEIKRLSQVLNSEDGKALVDPNRRAQPDMPVKAAADELLTHPLSEMKTAEQKKAWGRAKFWKGEYGEAAQALQSVALEEPDNHDVLRTLGWALVLGGKPELGVLRMREALETAEAQRSYKALRYRIDLAWAHLYLTEKQGYWETLKILEELCRTNPTQAEDPRVNAYLACAHGQAFRTEGKTEDKTNPHRIAALRCIAKVGRAANNQGWVNLLKSLRDPQPGSSDDDLVAFRGDPDFDAALEGRDPPEAQG